MYGDGYINVMSISIQQIIALILYIFVLFDSLMNTNNMVFLAEKNSEKLQKFGTLSI